MVSQQPRYEVIARTLSDEITSGRYRLGSKLPSEAALMRRFSCSRNTVRGAIARLAEIGLITTKRGSGSYVTKQTGIIHSLSSLRSISQVIRDLGLEPGMTQVTLRPDPNPGPDVQAFLGPGQVWRLRRVTTASGVPFSINDSWFLEELASQLNARALIKGSSLYHHFAADLKRPVASAVDYIGAEVAGPLEARLLEIDAGWPLLAILRYATDVAEHPIEVAKSIARADMYRYYVQLKAPVNIGQ